MRFLLHFIPPEYLADRKLKFSIFAILKVNFGFLTYNVFLFLFFWITDFTIGVYICTCAFVLALGFYPLTRYCKSLLFNGFYYTIGSLFLFSCVSIVTGGINSPFSIWLLTVPPTLFFYFPRKYAVKMAGVAILVFILVAFSNFFPLAQFTPLHPLHITIIRLCNFCLFTYVMIGIVQSSRDSHRYLVRKIQSTNLALQQSNEELQDFASIASHDLQTPLKSINATVQALMLHKKGKVDEVEEKCLGFIHKSTKRLYSLIEEILKFSRAGQESLTLTKVDLNEIVQEVNNAITRSAQHKNFIIKSDPLPTINSDRTMIYQLFQNIIENGLKYNKSAHPAVWIQRIPSNQFFHLTFTDNGIGISKKDHQTVFGMFKRVTHNNEFKGTGVGLAICKKYIGRIGGKLWIESEIGAGSTFNLEIPINAKPSITNEMNAVVNPEVSTVP